MLTRTRQRLRPGSVLVGAGLWLRASWARVLQLVPISGFDTGLDTWRFLLLPVVIVWVFRRPIAPETAEGRLADICAEVARRSGDVANISRYVNRIADGLGVALEPWIFGPGGPAGPE